MRLIKSVTHNKIRKEYVVNYIEKRKSRKDVFPTIKHSTEIYSDKDVPEEVLDWAKDPNILKEEEIDDSIAHIWIGDWMEIDGELCYRRPTS